mgnify:FL=1
MSATLAKSRFSITTSSPSSWTSTIAFLLAFNVALIPVVEEYPFIASLRLVKSEVAAVVPRVTVAEIACAVEFFP